MPDQPITKKQWREFHERLAAELSISVSIVATVRTLALHEKLSRKDVALWLAEKITLPRKSRPYSKVHYQSILDFTSSATGAQWFSLLRDYRE
jgi:hypothetical protein